MSTVSKGNYYKQKSKKWFEAQGYEVAITEFMCATQIGNKCFYRKIDIFSSDGIAMNEKEIIFWNSKHTITGSIANEKSSGKKDYQKHRFPSHVKRQLVIWEPRKQPVIVDVL